MCSKWQHFCRCAWWSWMKRWAPENMELDSKEIVSRSKAGAEESTPKWLSETVCNHNEARVRCRAPNHVDIACRAPSWWTGVLDHTFEFPALTRTTTTLLTKKNIGMSASGSKQIVWNYLCPGVTVYRETVLRCMSSSAKGRHNNI